MIKKQTKTQTETKRREKRPASLTEQELERVRGGYNDNPAGYFTIAPPRSDA